ncbi:MAG: hypothetical protein R3Y39_08590 [Rikenellaceae bacterium]
MKGEEIKKIIKEEGYVLSDVANLLGYDNDQRLHSALKANDVKSGLLEEIARVTNISIYKLLGVKEPTSQINQENSEKPISQNSVVKGDNAHVKQIIEGMGGECEYKERQEFIGLLKEKDNQMNELIAVIKKLTNM